MTQSGQRLDVVLRTEKLIRRQRNHLWHLLSLEGQPQKSKLDVEDTDVLDV